MRVFALITCASLSLAAAAWSAPKPAGKPAAKAPAKPAAAAKGGKYDEAKLTALEAKLTKSPNDAKLKTEVAEANYQVGYTMEYNSNLPPRARYRGALQKYNRTLALNPKHAKAMAEKVQIEKIYQQMGMPIPK
jgi:hypothetical protein